ncbi:DNA-binding protein [Sodalis-like symbiont of Bactericera trigonica]|nr:DNA-binding protein [Sodalis-like symbiont of Bactericera trigonica]
MSNKENYSEVRRVFSNIRSTRAFARETDFELLKDMHEKLGAVIEERRVNVEKEAAERALREEKRKEILQLIEGEGFAAEDLLGDDVEISKKRSKKPKAPAKYEFVENSEIKTWTGKGRKPKPIAEAMSAGRSLEEFLINKDSE